LQGGTHLARAAFQQSVPIQWQYAESRRELDSLEHSHEVRSTRTHDRPVSGALLRRRHSIFLVIIRAPTGAEVARPTAGGLLSGRTSILLVLGPAAAHTADVGRCSAGREERGSIGRRSADQDGRWPSSDHLVVRSRKSSSSTSLRLSARSNGATALRSSRIGVVWSPGSVAERFHFDQITDTRWTPNSATSGSG
jgi:hypothetical protein